MSISGASNPAQLTWGVKASQRQIARLWRGTYSSPNPSPVKVSLVIRWSAAKARSHCEISDRLIIKIAIIDEILRVGVSQ